MRCYWCGTVSTQNREHYNFVLRIRTMNKPDELAQEPRDRGTVTVWRAQRAGTRRKTCGSRVTSLEFFPSQDFCARSAGSSLSPVPLDPSPPSPAGFCSGGAGSHGDLVPAPLSTPQDKARSGAGSGEERDCATPAGSREKRENFIFDDTNNSHWIQELYANFRKRFGSVSIGVTKCL